MWGLQSIDQSAFFWLKALEYPVCFIHTMFFHFVLVFTGKTRKYRGVLATCYALSSVFALALYHDLCFDLAHIRNRPPFIFCPLSTPVLDTLIFVQSLTVLFCFYICFKTMRTTTDLQLRSRLFFFLIASTIGWVGGLTNWFYFYDEIPIPPVGNWGVTVFLIFTFYLLLKHNFLALNIVLKRTFVYAMLSLTITLIYSALILISERYFQSYFGYSSLLFTVAAGCLIAFIFVPLRDYFSRSIERAVYGKDIGTLSDENLLLMNEMRNHDRLKSVATLAAGMAHEIKNPLTSIRTFAEYLPKKYDDPEFRQKFSNLVVDEVDRVNSIIQQLLEFSKPKELEIQQFELGHLIVETLDLLSSNLLKSKIDVERAIENNLHISGDRRQLRQVFLNLFLNAIQAMPGGGTLKIAASKTSDGGVSILVDDTGPGIPKEHLSHIFDPFFTTKEAGSGLGLAVVHGIISRHGGRIKARNPENQGANFEINLNKYGI